MYNSKQLEPFFKKVHEEASKAAQKVYDSYTPELKERLLKQMYIGDELIFGMGTCFIKNKENVNDDFQNTISDNTEYWNKVEAGFNMDNLTKH